MKKLMTLLFACSLFVFVACNGGGESGDAEGSDSAAVEAPADTDGGDMHGDDHADMDAPADDAAAPADSSATEGGEEGDAGAEGDAEVSDDATSHACGDSDCEKACCAGK